MMFGTVRSTSGHNSYSRANYSGTRYGVTHSLRKESDVSLAGHKYAICYVTSAGSGCSITSYHRAIHTIVGRDACAK